MTDSDRRVSLIAATTVMGVIDLTEAEGEVLKDRGYAVTDIVDAALNEFLDRAGVPQAE